MNLLPLLLAVSLAAGNAEFEQASVDAAADIALERLKAETAERGLATNVLAQTMLANPVAYRTRPEAEALCRDLYRAELERVYRARGAEILRGLGLVREDAGPDAAFLDETVARHFAADFDRDRRDACTAQAATIALKVKPDEAELEVKEEDEARAWLTRRIAEARGFTVFEENLKYIASEIVDPILADARKERQRQREYLMRTRSDAYAPDVLAREIEANLRKNVAERKAKCDDPERAWGVFPNTLKATLPGVVERRVVGLAVKDVDEAPLALDASVIRSTIAADPTAHRTLSASEAIFRKAYAEQLTEAAVVRAASRAPSAEREAFAAFVREHAGNADLVRAVDARLKRDTLPKWRTVRAEIVREETDRLWPMLADRTWYPGAELADRIAARSDYAHAVRAWREAPELAGLVVGKERALEESDARADKSVAEAFELARSAIAAQHVVVGHVYPNVLVAAKDLSKGLFAKKPDLASVTEMLTKSVENEWDETRAEVLWSNREPPENAEQQHKVLFPSVRREIELVARQILEELEKREKKEGEGEGEERSKTVEQPPEAPPPEEPPPEEELPEELCTISFEMKGGEVTVQAKRGNAVVVERTAKATACGFENAVREVGSVVAREIFRLK